MGSTLCHCRQNVVYFQGKKADLLVELQIDTMYVSSFPKPSYSIIDKMALVPRVKRTGLNFDKTTEKPLMVHLHLQMAQTG